MKTQTAQTYNKGTAQFHKKVYIFKKCTYCLFRLTWRYVYFYDINIFEH